MRRIAFGILTLTLLLLFNYLNAVVRIDYDLNLFEYFKYSRAFTPEERRLLDQYGVLIFGGNINDPPLGRYYEETGQHLGLTVDIVNALAIELQTNIATKAMVWSDAVEALRNEETNLIDMVPSQARTLEFAFSNPIYRLSGAVLIPGRSADIQSLKDLDGKAVAVQRADVVIDKLWERGIFPNFIYTDHLYEAMKLLESGQAVALAGDEPVIRMILAELRPSGSYSLLEERIYNAYTALAVPRSQQALIPVLNKGILRLRKSGVMSKIEEKWLGAGAAETQRRSYEKMKHLWLPLLGIMAMLFYSVYLWNLRLKSLVARRTQELTVLTEELESLFNTLPSGLLLTDRRGILKKTNTVIEAWSGLSEGHSLEENAFGLTLLEALRRAQIKTEDGTLEPSQEYQEALQIGDRLYDLRRSSIQAPEGLFLILLTDVTLEQLKSQKLNHSSKMEAIGRLAAGIAHELRNPLGTIRNSSYLLAQCAGPGDTDAGDESLQTATAAIDRAVIRAGKIIDNLLNYARLSSDEISRFSAPDLVTETLSFFKKSMSEQGVLSEYTHQGPDWVSSNPSALRHILMNLIHNAIDAMPQGGHLRVTSEASDTHLAFKIQDTGVGIAPDKLDKIFEPFYTEKPIGQGTGLGLYLVYTEVEKLGGEVHVMSALRGAQGTLPSSSLSDVPPSSATTFTVLIPLKEAIQHATPKTTPD